MPPVVVSFVFAPRCDTNLPVTSPPCPFPTYTHPPMHTHNVGDKPELLYPEAAAELAAMGYSSTLQYVEAAAGAVLKQTGLIPHINAGVMDQQQLHRYVCLLLGCCLVAWGSSQNLAAEKN